MVKRRKENHGGNEPLTERGEREAVKCDAEQGSAHCVNSPVEHLGRDSRASKNRMDNKVGEPRSS